MGMGFFDEVFEWLTGGTRPYPYDGGDPEDGDGHYGGLSHDEWEELNDAQSDCSDGCCTGADDDVY
jgi:hypothetical protein